MMKTGAQIVGCDGKQVGVVESVEGETRIRLKAVSNPTSYDFIPMEWVQNQTDETVTLDRSAQEAIDSLNVDIPAGEHTS